jgi:hypothetical protein
VKLKSAFVVSERGIQLAINKRTLNGLVCCAVDDNAAELAGFG